MDQPPARQLKGKVRLTGYITKELDQALRDLLDKLPRSVKLSDVLESALQHEVARIERDGWPKPSSSR